MRLALALAALTAAALWASAAECAQPVRLTRTAIRLHDGEVWGHWGSAFLCTVGTEELRWKADKSEVNSARFAEIFDEELSAAGLSAPSSDNLFDDAPRGGLQVGVAITHIDAQICSASDDDYGTNRTFRGTMSMTADWQIYDPVRAQVIAKITTTATGEEKKRSRDGVERVAMAAFRASARELISKDAFHRLLTSAPVPGPAASYAPLTFQPSPAARLPIPSSSTAVATIFAGDGWGSGFLISSDGYLLTNRHVVGDAERVRVRWSDGSEGVGRVLRSDVRRDVALISADAHGRMPLPLRRSPPQPGETVLAIGTPLEKSFQNTVTKGVVSANRMLDGLTFVQSDVAVDHGNSGGPLLDDQGRAIAITQWGYAPDGVSHNLNFFIPIDDALRALALTEAAEPMRTAAPATRAPAHRKR